MGLKSKAPPVSTSSRSGLRRVEALVQNQPLLVRANEHEIVLTALREAAHGDAFGTIERFGEKAISALAALVGAEELRLFDVEEVDLVSAGTNSTSSRVSVRAASKCHEFLFGELHVLIARTRTL